MKEILWAMTVSYFLVFKIMKSFSKRQEKSNSASINL